MKCGAIGFRVSVSRKVSRRSVQMLWARQMRRSVQMIQTVKMRRRSVERSLVELSKIKNSTYFHKRVLSKKSKTNPT
jgi:hypothetical protein